MICDFVNGYFCNGYFPPAMGIFLPDDRIALRVVRYSLRRRRSSAALIGWKSRARRQATPTEAAATKGGDRAQSAPRRDREQLSWRDLSEEVGFTRSALSLKSIRSCQNIKLYCPFGSRSALGRLPGDLS